MIKVETSVHVDRHPDEVFEFISNFENNPKWQSGMVSARFTSQGALRVGSTYAQEAKFLGRPVISEFEVIEYEPNRMVKAASTSGSFPITFTRMVKAQDNGTLVSAVIEGDASGFFKLAQPLMRRMVQKSVDEDYRNLKRILENKT
jgi:uncharacterized membrane protein